MVLAEKDRKWTVAVLGKDPSDEELVSEVSRFGFKTSFSRERFNSNRHIEDCVGECDVIIAKTSMVTTHRGSKTPFLNAARKYATERNLYSPMVMFLVDDASTHDDSTINEYTNLMRHNRIMSYVMPGRYMPREVMQRLIVARAKRGGWKKETLEDRILLVEDDKSYTDQFLTYAGLESDPSKMVKVDIAHDVRSAILKIRSHDYRVVILDKHLPDSERMNVEDLATWIRHIRPFTQLILHSGDARSSDQDFFDTNILRKPVTVDIAYDLTRVNIEISKKMIGDWVRNTYGSVYIIGGTRGAGKTTMGREATLAWPVALKPKRPVTRPPRNEEDYEDHDFVEPEDILPYKEDPNRILFEKTDNDGVRYWGGMNLSDIDSALREGRDIVLPVAEPSIAETLYGRYGNLVETILIHNPDSYAVSGLVTERDGKQFTPEQVRRDLKKYSVFKHPYIIPNFVNPFGEIKGDALRDPVEMAKSGILDNGVKILVNKIMADRIRSRSVYNVANAINTYARRK